MAEAKVSAGSTSPAPASPSGPTSPSSAYEALKAIPEPDLTKLSPVRRPRQKPGQWDGRVAGLSLNEYRALKWGVEAGHRMTTKGGSSFSIQGRWRDQSKSSPDVLLETDIYKSWYAMQASSPSFSLGRLPIVQQERERSVGPAHYPPRDVFGSRGHPTLSKDLGRQFGRERLLVSDFQSPAPGDYDVSGFEKTGRYKKSPDYQCQGREAWREPPVAPGPGAGDYQFDEVFRTGKHTGTLWTVQGKSEMTQPPTGAAATRLQKRLDQLKRSHKFEVEINFKKISPILLALDAPQLMEICKKLQDNASLIRDPNTFLVAAAMKKLGNSGGYGARKPVMPGPTHYSCPGAGGLEYATKEKPPEWKFGHEHRGLS